MNKISYYGIDLGTTNSAISKFDGLETTILKNRQQMDVTPSVVSINKKGTIKVGLDAYQTLFNDPDNVANEFKRLIGGKETKRFNSSNIEMNAEELSAEILKSLVSDAKLRTGDEINQIVITVPAAFSHLQCEATARAAKLANLDEVSLLQEPIAAAMAYGISEDSNDKIWLVYDLGGGTFDIAIVSTKGGKLSIIEHEGDNMLGGKDIDRLIVEKIFIPNLEMEYDLPTPEDNPRNYEKLIKILQRKAEEIKIDLSYSEEATASIFNVGVDEDGEIIETEFEVTRQELSNIIKPLIDKTIRLCYKTIERARLTSNDVESIVLVGGTTYIPYLRERLENDLNTTLLYSIDPMTVVARGASIYAASIPTQNTNNDYNFKDNSDALRVDITYDSIASGTEAFISGFIEDILDEVKKYAIRFSEKSGYWNSGWIQIRNGYFETDLVLIPNRINDFIIEVRDENGSAYSLTKNSFTISALKNSIGEIPLPYSIGIEHVLSDGKTEMDIIFPRSTSLPVEKTIVYKAAKTLRPNQDDYIAIKVWEGEYPNPEDNNFIAALKIGAEEIKRPIPEGAEIEMFIKIDTSRKMTVEAFVASINEHFDKNVYTAEPEAVPTVEELEKQMNMLYEIIDELDESVEIIKIDDEQIEKIEEQLEDYKNDVENLYIRIFKVRQLEDYADNDEKKQIKQETKKIRGELSLIAKQIEKYHISDEIYSSNDEMENTKKLVLSYGDREQNERFALLERDIERKMEKQDKKGTQKIEKKMEELKYQILFNQEWFWEVHLRLVEEYDNYIDQDMAENLLNQANIAFENKDYSTLRKLMLNLYDLMPRDEAEIQKEKVLRAGIKKGII